MCGQGDTRPRERRFFSQKLIEISFSDDTIAEYFYACHWVGLENDLDAKERSTLPYIATTSLHSCCGAHRVL
jgi:hypothetical protein